MRFRIAVNIHLYAEHNHSVIVLGKSSTEVNISVGHCISAFLINKRNVRAYPRFVEQIAFLARRVDISEHFLAYRDIGDSHIRRSLAVYHIVDVVGCRCVNALNAYIIMRHRKLVFAAFLINSNIIGLPVVSIAALFGRFGKRYRTHILCFHRAVGACASVNRHIDIIELG